MVVPDSSTAATGSTPMATVPVVGSSAVELIATTATVDIPATTILTTGGCHPLPVLCHMSVPHFADNCENPSTRRTLLPVLFPVTSRANQSSRNKVALSCGFVVAERD